MTTEQRDVAEAIGEEIGYTGFNNLLIDSEGKWVSPAIPSRVGPDALLFVWMHDGCYTYKGRAGDRIGDRLRVNRGETVRWITVTE